MSIMSTLQLIHNDFHFVIPFRSGYVLRNSVCTNPTQWPYSVKHSKIGCGFLISNRKHQF